MSIKIYLFNRDLYCLGRLHLTKLEEELKMALNGNRSCGFRFASAIILRKYASYSCVGVVS